MSAVNPIGPGPAPHSLKAPPPNDDARLKKTATQMEGLFVQRLFAAMRDTVPEGGMIDQSSAEQTFTSMLDEKISQQVPGQWDGPHSLAHSLYNQLRQRIASQHAAATAASGPESPK
jgi:flagellar protein FlgJ